MVDSIGPMRGRGQVFSTNQRSRLEVMGGGKHIEFESIHDQMVVDMVLFTSMHETMDLAINIHDIFHP